MQRGDLPNPRNFATSENRQVLEHKAEIIYHKPPISKIHKTPTVQFETPTTTGPPATDPPKGGPHVDNKTEYCTEGLSYMSPTMIGQVIQEDLALGVTTELEAVKYITVNYGRPLLDNAALVEQHWPHAAPTNPANHHGTTNPHISPTTSIAMECAPQSKPMQTPFGAATTPVSNLTGPFSHHPTPSKGRRCSGPSAQSSSDFP